MSYAYNFIFSFRNRFAQTTTMGPYMALPGPYPTKPRIPQQIGPPNAQTQFMQGGRNGTDCFHNLPRCSCYSWEVGSAEAANHSPTALVERQVANERS